MATVKKRLDFASTLSKLEKLVGSLEDDQTSLEQSLTNFELGIRLLKEAQKSLHTAEQKVNTLIDADGEPELEPIQLIEDEQ